jgi:restriction system protein
VQRSGEVGFDLASGHVVLFVELDADARRMAVSLLPDPASEVVERLRETAGGNPLVIEALVDDCEFVAQERGTRLRLIKEWNGLDLEPVRPVIEFDLSRYKFVKEVDIASGLDSRRDLLDLSPTEFEHLIRELFQAIGMASWVTEASRDEGVDAVATDTRPLMSGKVVIQAKRYRHIVGLESIHALAGTMSDHAATKGFLVTTSWVGKKSREFAARHGRIEIIDGRELKHLLKEHLDKNVRIALPKVPRGWERQDIS